MAITLFQQIPFVLVIFGLGENINMYENEKGFISFVKKTSSSLYESINATEKINFFAIPLAIFGTNRVYTSIIFLPLVLFFFVWLRLMKRKKEADFKIFYLYKFIFDIYFAAVVQLFNYKFLCMIDKYTDLSIPVPLWLILTVVFAGVITYISIYLLTSYRISTGYFIRKNPKKKNAKKLLWVYL